MAALHRILRYVQSILNHGLQLYKSSISSLLSYTNGDWGGFPDTHRSTFGYCVLLGDNLVSGPLNDRLQFLNPVLKLNIVVLLLLSSKLIGSIIYFLSYIILFLLLLLLLCTMIMLVPFIFRATQLIISALSIVRWTFILFAKRSNVVMFDFFMCFLVIKLQISSPKAILRFCLMIFVPVSTFLRLPIRLWGCIRVVSSKYCVNMETNIM